MAYYVDNNSPTHSVKKYIDDWCAAGYWCQWTSPQHLCGDRVYFWGL